MEISSINHTSHSNPQNPLQGKQNSSFEDVLKLSKQPNSVSEQASSEENIVNGKQTYIAPDGTVWTIIDIGASLTSKDKFLLGWPSDDQTIRTIGARVARDRHNGTLKGELTEEYLFGNPAKNMIGIVDVFPPGEFSASSLTSLHRRFGVSQGLFDFNIV